MLRRIPAARVIRVALLSFSVLGSRLAARGPGYHAHRSPLVVTATRSETEARRLFSSSVSVVTGAELRERGFRFVLDWLHEVPGLNVVQTGSFGGQTSLFTRGGESDYTKVLIDGVPANQPGGAIDLAHLGTELVERIEIVRGPSSVLYGSDAVSGVIQIVTRRGAGRPRIDVAARFGTFGTADLQAEAAGASGIARWSAGLSRFTSDGIYPYNNHYRNQTASARLALVPDEKTDLAFTARWGDSRDPLSDRLLGRAGGHQPVRHRARPHPLARWRAAALLPALAPRAGGTLRFEDRIRRRAGRPRRPERLRVRVAPHRPGDSAACSICAPWWRRLAALQLSGGVEFSNEDQHATNETTSDFGDWSVHRRQRVRPRPREHGVLRPGAGAARRQGRSAGRTPVRRQRRLRQLHDLAARAWRCGRPTLLKLHASAGSAFKQPTFSEQFADSPFEVGDPDLVPEESTSWQAGAELGFAGRRVTMSATYFAQHFSNMILYTSAAGPGEPDLCERGARRARTGSRPASTWRSPVSWRSRRATPGSTPRSRTMAAARTSQSSRANRCCAGPGQLGRDRARLAAGAVGAVQPATRSHRIARRRGLPALSRRAGDPAGLHAGWASRLTSRWRRCSEATGPPTSVSPRWARTCSTRNTSRWWASRAGDETDADRGATEVRRRREQMHAHCPSERSRTGRDSPAIPAASRFQMGYGLTGIYPCCYSLMLQRVHDRRERAAEERSDQVDPDVADRRATHDAVHQAEPGAHRGVEGAAAISGRWPRRREHGEPDREAVVRIALGLGRGGDVEHHEGQRRR